MSNLDQNNRLLKSNITDTCMEIYGGFANQNVARKYQWKRSCCKIYSNWNCINYSIAGNTSDILNIKICFCKHNRNISVPIVIKWHIGHADLLPQQRNLKQSKQS